MYSQQQNDMRYGRIFLLYFQHAFVYRSRSFVWFLTSLFDLGLIVFFWNGAASGKIVQAGWDLSSLISYYLFALIAGALLVPHMEMDIARLDIQMGGLSAYLLKPFSYINFLFIAELPWRIIAGCFGIIAAVVFTTFSHIHLQITNSVFEIVLACFIALEGYLIAFLFKMIIGLFAFWIIEIRGVFEAVEVIMIILMGNLMPLNLLPQWVQHIAYISPFSYIIYFPILAFEGKLSFLQLVQTLGIQAVWIGFLFFFYQKLWQAGLRKFSAVGQ